MDILYCGIEPSGKYPGVNVETVNTAIRKMAEQSFDVIVWSWNLGPLPAFTAPPEGGLVLVSDRESLELYRFAVRENCHQIVIAGDAVSLEDAISQALESVRKRRRDAERSALFEQYGSHLNMHLWYDLIVDGKYENLVDVADYRLILFHQENSGNAPLSDPSPQTDSRTILSEIFPEAIVILALQRGWECVVLPGNVRRFSNRAAESEAALAQRLGFRRKMWESPKLVPSEIHGFYLDAIAETMRRSGQGQRVVSTLVIDYIHSHLGDRLTRKELSDHLFFSPDHLAKVFLAETGVTLGTYVCNARLARAKQQLAETSAPVGVIAAGLGYHNFSEFSQWFKKLTGLSPSRYREESAAIK